MSEYEDDPILFKNYKTFHENMKDQRQKLMERANRLESMGGLGKSYDRTTNISYYSKLSNRNYKNEETYDSSPKLIKYSTISPTPTRKINISNQNTQSQKISKKNESKTKIYLNEDDLTRFKTESSTEIIPYRYNIKIKD